MAYVVMAYTVTAHLDLVLASHCCARKTLIAEVRCLALRRM